jgi:hypothetical protein
LRIVILLFTAAPLAAAERFFDSGGVRIRYIEERRGEPIVFDPWILTKQGAPQSIPSLPCKSFG